MFTAILGALAAIPKIIDALTSLAQKAEDVIEYFQMRARAAEFKDAINQAKLTKDTSDLERLLNRPQ